MSYILTKDPNRLSQIALTDISETSLELIHRHTDLLQTLINPIVDALYDKIYKIEHLNRIIDKYSNLEKLKVTQRMYLSQVFAPILDDRYIQMRYNIGKTHSKIGLELNWYMSAYQQYYQIITKNLITLLPADEVFALSSAIHSLFNFDMQITLDAYNKIEVDKAEYPLRYEFKHIQAKTGLMKADFDTLDLYSGRFTFRLEEILDRYEESVLQRSIELNNNMEDTQKLIHYLKRFLLQFFQEKVYRDETAFYRIIRDWVKVMVKKNISDQKISSLIDMLNEVLRETFIAKADKLEKEHLLFLASFERLSRFTLAVIRELLTPYTALSNYRFLQIYSYEIEKNDFGKITWTDENTTQLLVSRGIHETEIVGKRCFELFYNRVFPCTGCPVRNDSQEAFLTTYEQGAKSTYYKTWQLPQSKMVGLSHRLLVSQDVTEESKVIFDTVESLLQLAELRDDVTGKHVDRIGLLAGKLAQLAGSEEKFVQEIKLAAKFHDVGKVGIPDSILNKPGKLTSEEWESMKTHPRIGQQILSKLELPVIQMAARIAETHHEKWNGQGYPSQLKEDEIPLEGRIVAIVDVFDALLSKRAYKDAFPLEKVKEIMMEGRGTHFDPELTDLFLYMWDEFVDIHQKCAEEDIQLLV